MDMAGISAAPMPATPSSEGDATAEESASPEDKGGSVDVPRETSDDGEETPAKDAKAPASKSAPASDKPAAPKAPPKKMKIGEEEFDEDTILKAIKGPMEMAKGAQKRFQELAKAAKEIEAARAEIDQDPFALARKQGKDPIALAQKILEDAIAKSEMTPEARRIADLEERLNSNEKQGKEAKEAQDRDAQMKFYQSEIERLDKELPGAMERAGLPKSPVSLRLMTNILADMHDAKIPENLDIAAEIAAEQYSQDLGAHIKALSYEQALAKYPDLVKTIRAGDLASARKAPQGKPSQSAPRAANGKPAAPPSREQLMADEWGPLGVTFKAQ
jgi:hypothetical protein